MFRTPLLVAVAAVSLFASAVFASGEHLELRGQVTGDRPLSLRVQLFAVAAPYTASVPVSTSGEFRFRDLAPGDYTVAVVSNSLGEIRRTVVIRAEQAGEDGVVRIEIPYSAAEAARSGTAGIVSLAALSVPEKARDKYTDAQAHLARHDVEGAIDKLREAVGIAPKYAAAWNVLGVIAFQQGDLDAAGHAFRQAVDADPEAFEPTVNLAGLLLRSGRAEEALAYNRRAVEQRPADAQANAQLGMNLFQLGRMEEAAPYLEAAEEADPALQSQPQLFLAEIYRQRGNRERAIRELEDALARHPQAANAAAVRGALAKLRD